MEKKIVNCFNVTPTFGWSMLNFHSVMGCFLPIATRNDASIEVLLNFSSSEKAKKY